MATISDVAKTAGVSIGTVSAVINNKANVKDTTREKVLKAIKELNYHPNANARSLHAKKTKVIAVLVPDIINPGYAKTVKAISAVARSRGYSVFLGDTEGSVEAAKSYVARIVEMRAAGVIFSLTWECTQPEFLDSYRLYGIHSLGISGARQQQGLDCFQYDEEQGAFMAGRYLCNLGHRRFAVLAPEKSAVGRQRMDGLQKAFRSFNVNTEDIHIGYMTGYDEDACYDETIKVLSKGEPFTCMIVFNDRVAVGAMNALFEQGYAIPDDVSLLTFGDATAKIVRPQLTTVSFPEHQLGIEAVSYLIDKIEGRSQEPSGSRLYEPSLVLRTSTRKLNENAGTSVRLS